MATVKHDFRALMLDFYGTVVHDDDAVIRTICQGISSGCGRRRPAADIAAMWSASYGTQCSLAYGPTFRNQRDIACSSLAEVLGELGIKHDVDQALAPQFDYWRRPRLCEDAVDFLQRADVPICIVSNIDREALALALGYHRLVFANVVTSEDAMAYKPRPEPFLRALDQLGARGGSVLHIGDSLSNDVKGALGAGVQVAWVNRSNRPQLHGLPMWTEVPSLSALADILF